MTLPITIFEVEGNFSELLIIKQILINHSRKKTDLLLYSLWKYYKIDAVKEYATKKYRGKES